MIFFLTHCLGPALHILRLAVTPQPTYCFSTFSLEWNPLENLNCTQNFMQQNNGLFYSEMGENIIFLHLVMHEKTSTDTGVCE